jgi:DNA helicase-2/ATP-dependent DNA helicase PcrA
MSDDAGDTGLHEAQREAAEAPEPVIAVLAGPGSGKTRTLSARARFLLLRDAGSEALVLTFMNKAAAEMKSRCLTRAPFAPSRIWAGTFHAFCASLLRDHHELAGVAAAFDVLDAEDARELAVEAGGSASELFCYNLARSARQPIHRAMAGFVDAYEQAKQREGVLDFTDLVVRGAALLEDQAELAAAYGRRYRHVLVDEFQDTDASRYAVIRALAPHVATISMFADDDQAIMSFAGADRGNVARFVAGLSARRIALTVNYRSRGLIVAAANRLVAADESGSGRAMSAVRSGGSHRGEPEEAAAVAEFVSNTLAQRPPEDIAILARTKWRADAVAEALTQGGIPLSDWRVDIVDIRARRAVASCLAVLRSRVASRHERLLCEMAGILPSALGDTAAVLDALDDHDIGPKLRAIRQAGHGGASVVEIVAMVCALVAERLPALATDLGFVREAVDAFAAHDVNFSLEHLLTELALGAGGQGPTVGGGVKLATLHRTKGLQWPVVVVIGMEQECLPHYRSMHGNSLSEERRLCFVGVSRAEDVLVLSRAQRTGNRTRAPSQFIAELMPEE